MTDRFEAITALLREAVGDMIDARLGSHQRAVDTVQQAMPGSQVVSDGWGGEPADPWPGDAQPQQWATASPQPNVVQTVPAAPQQAPSCQHGPLKAVPGGYSQAKQKAYNAFWACPGPRGQQCRLNAQQLPPVPGA